MARVVEWFSLNPNWVGTKTLYLVQKVIKRCLMIVSKILYKNKSSDEYKFLGWIDCFIRRKATRSNVCNTGDIQLEVDAE